MARYGVPDATQAPEVVARRAATNLERYGAANPFAKGATTYEKVQASLEGKRPVLKGADNPFAKEDVKARIRATMTERYGTVNPQQAPELRARTKATHEARYGGELLGSPALRERIETTNVERYGDARPSRNPMVVERARQTNLGRYGVPWTAMDPDIRRRQLETVLARYGSPTYFGSERGKAEVRAALTERYGVAFPGAIDGHWEKALTTFRRNHDGLTHPLQLGRPAAGPNKLEARVHAMAPVMVFTGNGTYWRHLPLLDHHKNPDFIVPGPDPSKPKKGVTKVVEVFGDFWHSRMFTGRAPFDHEQDLVDAYADVGIQCLVLWEGEVRADPEGVRARLAGFVG